MKRAVIYARYSCSQQTEQSIEGQLHRCYEYAKINNLEVIDQYIDRATTGTNDRRPQFQKLLEDSKSRTFDFVLVYAVDRFARNPYDYYADKKILLDNGVNLLSTTEPLGTNADGTINLSGILTESIHSGYAFYYSKELSAKINRGREESMYKGTFLGGHLPYGYKVIDKIVHIDQDQAKIIEMIFNMYSENYTISDIMKECSKHGVEFKKTTLLAMLRNEKYIGIAKFKDTICDNMFPAIIDKALFYDVQDRFEKKKHSPSKLADGESYILSRKLYCGYCGSPMYGESGIKNGKKYCYYKCFNKKKEGNCSKKTVRKEVIEDIVVNATKEHLLTPKYVDIIVKEILEEQKENQAKSGLALMEQSLANVNRELHNISKAVRMGIFSPTLKTDLESLEDEKSALEVKIEVEKSRCTYVPEEYIRAWLDKFAHTDKTDADSKRYLVEYFVKRIVLFDDKIVILYNHLEDNKNSSDLTAEESSELFSLVVEDVLLPRIVIKKSLIALTMKID